MKLEKKLNNTLRDARQKYGESVNVHVEDRSIIVEGVLDTWQDAVDLCSMFAEVSTSAGKGNCASDADTNQGTGSSAQAEGRRHNRVRGCGPIARHAGGYHVVNNTTVKGLEKEEIRLPRVSDDSLEGMKPDVLIIGGGISGTSIARELMKWKLDVLLVDKEADVALHASGRNDGEVHPGVDLGKGTLKQEYVVKANRMFDQVCSELSVPFKRVGQFVGFFDKKLYLPIKMFAFQRKHLCGVDDTVVLSKAKMKEMEPSLSDNFQFALYNPYAGSVSPYELTIAYAENACTNGARVSLETAVLDMDVSNGKINSVKTNRGTIYPKLVINAVGVFSEDIAAMAKDRFFSIHPRRGTNSILDKNKGKSFGTIASWKTLGGAHAHTKGGGIVHTVSDNLLIGPDAIETHEKENFETRQESIDNIFEKQKKTWKDLSENDIITYFTGVRAATFEEDYVIEAGRKTHNLIHCAGIQSPGLTTAPVVAIDVAKLAVDTLAAHGEQIHTNANFDSVRKGIPKVSKLTKEERAALIKENPDYGKIVCRCEEISKGEILDALRSPLGVCSVDGVKKRVRPGMGRCQGGFCMPLVSKIISEELEIPLEEVYKNNSDSVITYGKIK